ncbi:MAG TPA: L,D-transpeptidase [bacterium]|nr:L,D-transpeptidase [bacterium]
MKRLQAGAGAAALALVLGALAARADYVGQYGASLCSDSARYYCVTAGKKAVEREVRSGQGTRKVRALSDPTWEDIFPDPVEREIVMKLNRLNYPLKAGYKIAVPKDLAGKSLMDFSPFPKKIAARGEKLIIFDPALLAFAAYDAEGTLRRWGPAVGGRAGLETRAGQYRITGKGGPDCRSRVYPRGCRGRGCSPMPYCMNFNQGAAFHGGPLPGRRESHGCVRLFDDDAKWLNLEFAEVGVKVEIRPYP